MSTSSEILVISGTHFASKVDKDVVFLNISSPIISFIPNSIFERFKNLKVVDLRRGSIREVSRKKFFNCDKLTEIRLAENFLESVPMKVFSDCEELKLVDLSLNFISVIDDDAFDGLDNLVNLDFNGNKLTSLRTKVVENMWKA